MKLQLLGLILLGAICSSTLAAQITLSKKVIATLQKKDDSLKYYGGFIMGGGKDTVRAVADSIFTKILVRALVIPNSYKFNFDSAVTISKVVAPDNSFRIFTWQLMLNEDFFIQRGVIQINTADGSPKLFPLYDRSSSLKKLDDSVRNNNNWVGALYYKIIAKTIQGNPAFILIGLDRNNAKTDKKWIDVLRFNPLGKPEFGAQIFNFSKDTGKVQKYKPYRFGIEYKKDARVRMNFDEDLNLIVYDHLDSEEEATNTNKKTFVPDGNYEAFEWKNEELIHIPNLYDYKAMPGDIPQGSLLDDDNSTELIKASEKNLEKEKAEKKLKPKNPKRSK